MDPLSDVLRVVRLKGGVFFTARLCSPWSFRSPPPDELARALGLQAECIALFHILAEGRCWLEIDDLPPVEVEAGTIIVLPHGHAHRVASRLDLDPEPFGTLLEGLSGDAVTRVSYGRGGEACRFVCGYFACDQRFNPLIGALPTLLLSQPEEGTLAAEPGADAGPLPTDGGEDGDWLRSTLRYVIEEAEGERPGSPAMLARQAELLYLEILRQYMGRLPEGRTGWLAGVRDPGVGRALRLLHERPERRWTVEELARSVHLSRSALGQRFARIVGEPPMRYLAGWRMQLAKHLLRQPELSIAQVAARVGYTSDVAFHRAFKRHVGSPPAAWRDRAS